MNIAAITNKLRREFKVCELKVVDDSVRHEGHDFMPSGEISHLRIMMVSDDFVSLGRLERQKLLHKALENEMALIHSVSFRLYTSEEYGCFIGGSV